MASQLRIEHMFVVIFTWGTEGNV